MEFNEWHYAAFKYNPQHFGSKERKFVPTGLLTMSPPSIQSLIDDSPVNTVVDLPKGDFGPVEFRRPIVLNANGATFWALGVNPAVRIRSVGVCLQNATLRSAPNATPSAVFEIAPETHPMLQNVRLQGRVDGLDNEGERWLLPKRLEVAEIRAPVSRFAVQLGVPEPARLFSRISGIEFIPWRLDEGVTEVMLIVRDVSQDSILIGDVELITAQLTRIIPFYTRVLRFTPDLGVSPLRTLFKIPDDDQRGKASSQKAGALLSLPEWFRAKLRLNSSVKIQDAQSVEATPKEEPVKDEEHFFSANVLNRKAVGAPVEMTPFLMRQKLRLFQLRGLILHMIDVERDYLRNYRDKSESNPFGMHHADAGSDACDRDLALNSLSHQREAFYQVEEALKRVDLGTYGICEMSGKPINHARLEALPFARFTVECQSQTEKQGKVTRACAPITFVFDTSVCDQDEACDAQGENAYMPSSLQASHSKLRLSTSSFPWIACDEAAFSRLLSYNAWLSLEQERIKVIATPRQGGAPSNNFKEVQGNGTSEKKFSAFVSKWNFPQILDTGNYTEPEPFVQTSESFFSFGN